MPALDFNPTPKKEEVEAPKAAATEVKPAAPKAPAL